MECDLSSQKSIREFVDKFTKSKLRIFKTLLVTSYYSIVD